MKQGLSLLYELTVREDPFVALIHADQVISHAKEHQSDLTQTSIGILCQVHHMKACILRGQVIKTVNAILNFLFATIPMFLFAFYFVT